MAEDPMFAIGEGMLKGVPHVGMLGMELVSIEPGTAAMRVPYNEALIGDQESGVMHGGVITTLLDNCCGAAVMSRTMKSTATLGLRIDYMRPATPGCAVTARAECYHVTRTVAFVRATAWDDDEDHPVASAAGTFTVDETSLTP